MFERISALAQRLEDGAVFVHLIRASEQLACDVLELVFFSGSQRRPELVQTVVLRWQNLTQEFMPFFGQLQMQAATVIVAFTAFNPAAFFQFIGDTGRIGAGRA